MMESTFSASSISATIVPATPKEEKAKLQSDSKGEVQAQDQRKGKGKTNQTVSGIKKAPAE